MLSLALTDVLSCVVDVSIGEMLEVEGVRSICCRPRKVGPGLYFTSVVRRSVELTRGLLGPGVRCASVLRIWYSRRCR